MMSHPAVYSGLMQMPFTDAPTWHARLIEMCAPGSVDLPLAAEIAGEVVGSSGLHRAGPAQRRRHVMMIGISVAPRAQGLGVGTALMAAICDYADNWVGVLRLELNVYTDNEVALRLYRKFGFEIEGTMRGYALRDGRYVDSYAMARLHPRPPRIET